MKSIDALVHTSGWWGSDNSFQFGLDQKRKTLRLGKCSLKHATTVAGHVEEIINAASLNRAVAHVTEEWLTAVLPVMSQKLEAVGLIHARENLKPITLGEFLDAYLVRRTDAKAGTSPK